MSVQLKRRRDSAANVAGFTGAQGEIVVDTTNNRIVLQDGVTAGGWPAAKLGEVVTNTRVGVSDANYTVLTSDRLVAYAALTAARVVSLPAAAAYPTGTLLWIVDEAGLCSSTLTLTITPHGSEKIDGAASLVLNGGYMAVGLESNGSNAWACVGGLLPNVEHALLGIGTAPDPSNALSVFGSSALFNGTNFSLTINKAASTDTASIIFEDGFSGRAQMGLNGSDNYSFKVSPDGSSWTTAIAIDAATGAPSFANQRTPVADAAYSALATDRLIAYTSLTAARIVTLPAAGAFSAGTPLTIIDESGAASATNTITVARAGSDTIGGATSALVRSARGSLTLESNGANAWTILRRSSPTNIMTFSSSGTYTPSPGMAAADVYLVSGGGGGGGGALQATSTACSGAGGGGGGSIAYGRFSAAQIGGSQSVTIGAGGATGSAASSSATAGSAGGQGGNTTFGSLLEAFGGGAGAGGQLAAASGGGGGGSPISLGANASGSTAGGGATGGSSGGSGAASSGVANVGGGTGGGGGGATGSGFGAGVSLYGPGGGGSGGGVTAANAVNNGGAGGPATFNATAGAAGTTSSPPGGAGASPSLSTRPYNLFVGAGGGGGASHLTAAGAGGGGGLPGGGGGGGGSSQNGGAAGAGGAGGGGYCIIVEFFG